MNKWAEYWRNAGKTYLSRFASDSVYQEQESLLSDLLKGIEFDSVLEIGCGFGRMTKIVWSHLPSRYLAIDVSSDQIDAARKYAPGPEYRVMSVEDLDLDERFDLVIASEVLMHIPPDRIESVVRRMLAWSKGHVVNIDLSSWSGPSLASHNWLHDYHQLYGSFLTSETMIRESSQSMFHVVKES